MHIYYERERYKYIKIIYVYAYHPSDKFVIHIILLQTQICQALVASDR